MSAESDSGNSLAPAATGGVESGLQTNNAKEVEQDKLYRSLLLEDVEARLASLKEGNRKFIHYTSADKAKRIIQGRSLWLRSASMMNDYSEVLHGLYLLNDAYGNYAGHRLREVLEKFDKALPKQVTDYVYHLERRLPHETFISCLSEHSPESDPVGRLSMWREYGVPHGVALVTNPVFAESKADILHAYTIPVRYNGESDMEDWLLRIADILEANRQICESAEPGFLFRTIAAAVLFGTVSCKNKIFAEEKEWRVVYFPKLIPSSHLTPAVETIDGVPQVVHKLSVRDIAAKGVPELEIHALLSQVIIGPCATPKVIQDALIEVLREEGFSEPEKMVVPSRIPLRSSRSLFVT